MRHRKIRCLCPVTIDELKPMMSHIDECKQIGFAPQAPCPAQVTTYAVPERNQNGYPPAAVPFAAVLWKGKRAITAAAACGSLAGVLVGLLTQPVYRGRASMLLESFNDQALRAVTPVSPLPASAVDYLQNEVKVLKSETLARNVAAQLGPALDSKAGVRAGNQSIDEQRIQRVQDALTVRTGLQSQVIEVFFNAPNPTLAARGANAVTSELIDLNQKARWQLVRDTTEWLNKQAAELKVKLDTLNRQLEDFTTSSGLVLPGKDGTPAEDRARQLQDAVTHAEADRAARQAKYQTARAGQGDVTSDALASSPLRQYETDLQNMRRQLADLSTIYQPDNYRITRLQAQIADTETAIAKERKGIRERLRKDYLAAASVERMLSRSLRGQLAKVEKQTEKELQYNVFKNEVETTQKLYDSVLERAKDAGAASSLRITNIRVIDRATPPPLPYVPNVPLNIALGLGIGTLGGVGLVLIGTRSSKVRYPGELTSACVPELGVVPSAPSELAAHDPDWIMRDTWSDGVDSSLFRESFRAALLSILFRTQADCSANALTTDAQTRVVVVTSVDMMEGKTTLVTNLGIASAQQKRDVLLIDADFRRPRLHQRFDLPNSSGLINALLRTESPELVEDPSLKSLVQPTKIPHLWVLTSGPVGAGAANLLYASGLNATVRQLARHFDVVLIDTPPMALYPEARVLGRVSDGVVMVVRANSRSREELHAAYQKLLEDRVPVLGAILNDWKIDRDQARAYYRYYQHYQNLGGGSGV